MLLKRLIIVGYPEGHLAGAIGKHAREIAVSNPGTLAVLFYDSTMNLDGMDLEGTMVIYAGKGGRLPEALDFCRKYHIPFIQASTGQDEPVDPTFPYVNAPNLAILIIAFFKGLKDFWKAYEPIQDVLKVHVLESHQAAKKSLPGTAVKIAKTLGYSMQAEDSVRDPEKQLGMGIPMEHLERHAYHKITIEGMEVEVGFTTKVLGLTPYGPGALWLCERILKGFKFGGGLRDGIYEAEYFLK